MTKSKTQYLTVERDISWMYFNHRILQEGRRSDVPLLERLSFLGIYSNNLDEFFRVRVATLNRIAQTDKKSIKQEADQAEQTLGEINRLNTEYIKEFAETTDMVIRSLEEQGVCLLTDKETDEEQKMFVRQFFRDKLNGTTLPLWFKGINQMEDEEDDAIYLAVKLSVCDEEKEDKQKKKLKKDYALLQIPVKQVGRFLRLPDKEGKACLMWMDDVVRLCLPWIFAGTEYNHFEAFAFKFTKDAEMEMENDVERVFEFIMSPFLPMKFSELLVSPNSMKPALLKLVNTEIQNHRLGKPAYIRMKVNHITDPDMVAALYRASSEGVPVDILCRGNCALIPGIKGVSETMHIRGIIDRYLEHSRILLFCNGGDERCYIGSADWMPRNLVNRIEVLTPIYNERIKKEMAYVVEAGLKDNVQARIVDGKGGDHLPELGDETPFRSQAELYKHYMEAEKG